MMKKVEMYARGSEDPVGWVEPERVLPQVGAFDVIVCGAGPAGMAAALAAAWEGASVALVEVHGCLGGIWTAGSLSWVIDALGRPGLVAVLMDRLERLAAVGVRRGRNFSYDIEAMKLVLETLCEEAGIHVRLHTRVVAAYRDGRRLRTIVTESKSGREAWHGQVFIDCTGDGDLAAQAGCGFDLGHPETGLMQPMSLVALVAGVEDQDIRPFVGGSLAEPKQRLLEAIRAGGVDPSYGSPTLFPIRKNLFALMANHAYGVSGLKADDLTRATLASRREVHAVIGALRSLGSPWKELCLVATAAQIGVREGRRVHGRYHVVREDLVNGVRHEDAVCEVTFGIDVHVTDHRRGRSYEVENEIETRPYQIPLRALIARDVDGLMMAGRCISGDFFAHASYRVTGSAVAMGEAAGIAAAQAAARRCLPSELSWKDVLAALRHFRQTPVDRGLGNP